MENSRQLYEKYFNEKLKGLIQDLTIDVLKHQPKQPINFMIKWLSRVAETSQVSLKFVSSRSNEAIHENGIIESEAMNEEELKKLQQKKKLSANQRRSSISAEAFGKYNQPKLFVPRLIQKEQAERNSIRKILKTSFMFSSLDEKQLETVIGCMKKKHLYEGQYIIKQGDIGNEIYVISRGKLSCTKKFKPTDVSDTFLKYYNPGQSFGQLALLYNVPRQASIFANEYSELWQLDRETFNNVVRDAVIKKKAHIKQLLKNVSLFQKMENSEMEKLVDSIKAKEYEQDQYVCIEGQQGQCLYIVDKGSLVAEKKIENKIKTVFEYKPGMYFGQVALVYDTKRKASVKCLQKSVLLMIGKNQFMRLIGVDEKLLKDFTKYQGLTIK